MHLWPTADLTSPETTPGMTAPVEILICEQCLGERPSGLEGPKPGELLHAALVGSRLPENVSVEAVSCLSNCGHRSSRGCSLVLRGPGRWTFLFRDLDETADLWAIMECARKYKDSPDGVVPSDDCPLKCDSDCVARIPPPSLSLPSLPCSTGTPAPADTIPAPTPADAERTRF